MSHPDVEKRDAERIHILGALRGEVMIFQPVAIKEISIGGADIESGFALQPNSLHDFRLSLGEHSVVVTGRVVRCAISDVDQEIVLYRSGVEFVELSDRVRSAITEFVDGLRTGRMP